MPLAPSIRVLVKASWGLAQPSFSLQKPCAPSPLDLPSRERPQPADLIRWLRNRPFYGPLPDGWGLNRTLLTRLIGQFLTSKVLLVISPIATLLLTPGERLVCQLLASRLSAESKRKGAGATFWQQGAYLALTSLRVNDPQLLQLWVIRRMSISNLRGHRRFLGQVTALLEAVYLRYGAVHGVRGLWWRVCGKLGVVGNARTRTYKFCLGNFSRGSLTMRFIQQFEIVWTRTGCLGFWMRYAA